MLDKVHLEELRAAGTVVRTCLYHLLNQCLQLRIEVTDAPLEVIPGCNYPLEELVHIGSLEGRSVAHGLIEDTSQGPDVALGVVGLILPDFRAGVEWCACLCV